MGIRTIVRKVKRGLVMRAVLWGTKGLANGKFGRGPQKAWLALEGFKTYIGLAFVVAGFTFGEAFNLGLCPDCPQWNQILMTVGVVLAQIGLLDGANRSPSVREDQIIDSQLRAQREAPEARNPLYRPSTRGGTQG